MNKKILSIIKLTSIVYLLIFLPKIISDKSFEPKIPKIKKNETLLGVQNLLLSPKYKWIKKLKFALISNTINENMPQQNPELELFLKQGFDLRKIFIPTTDKKQASTIMQNKKITLNKTQLPILKWKNNENIIPKEHIATYDALVFDMIYTGLRNDNCIESLIKTMETGAQYKKRVIVLDRPNPLGKCMEGPGEIPLRPGLTLGELALYLNKNHLTKPTKLTIIPLENWKRTQPLTGIKNQTLPYYLNNVNSCYAHSFLSLMDEINPVNVGTNTKKAYELLLLPPRRDLSDWETDHIKKLCFDLGIFCKSYSYWDKTEKVKYNGIQFRIKKDINEFSAFNTFLTLTRFLKNRKNIQLSCTNSFDDIIGTDIVKKYLENRLSLEQLKKYTKEDLDKFYKKAKSAFLYRPFPEINDIEIIKG